MQENCDKHAAAAQTLGGETSGGLVQLPRKVLSLSARACFLVRALRGLLGATGCGCRALRVCQAINVGLRQQFE
jgi:hypothetical protein